MEQQSIITKIVINSILFITIIVFGYILQKAGRPYNNLYFTIHKLATVAFVVYTSILLIKFYKSYGMSGILPILTIIGLLSIVVLLVSGGLMSVNKMHATMRIAHNIATFISLGTFACIFYLLWMKN